MVVGGRGCFVYELRVGGRRGNRLHPRPRALAVVLGYDYYGRSPGEFVDSQADVVGLMLQQNGLMDGLTWAVGC